MVAETKGKGGRPKGSKNKISADIKELILQVVDEYGYKGLKDFADTHPVEFWRMASRLVPAAKEVSGPDGGPIQTQNINNPPRPDTYSEWIKATKREPIKEA